MLNSDATSVQTAHIRFLERHYEIIRRWIKYNEADLAMYRAWDPGCVPDHLPITFARFVELEAMLDADRDLS